MKTEYTCNGYPVKANMKCKTTNTSSTTKVVVHKNSKTKMKKSNLPMVPTIDTIELPKKGVVNVHTMKSNEKLCPMPTAADFEKNSRKAMMQKAFVETGYTPEERLLIAIFGDKANVQGLPPALRTQKFFNKIWKVQERFEKKMEEEEDYIHKGHKYEPIVPGDAKKARKMLKEGKTYSEIGKALNSNAYSVKFCLSEDYNKPHILLLGEAQLREAKKTGNKKLLKIAESNIKEGKESYEFTKEHNKKFDMEFKARCAKLSKVLRENGIKKSYEVSFEDTDFAGYKKLAKDGILKPGAVIMTNFDNLTEYVYTGKSFVRIH